MLLLLLLWTLMTQEDAVALGVDLQLSVSRQDHQRSAGCSYLVVQTDDGGGLDFSLDFSLDSLSSKSVVN